MTPENPDQVYAIATAGVAAAADTQVAVGWLAGECTRVASELAAAEVRVADRDEVIRLQSEALTMRELTIREQAETIEVQAADLVAARAEALSNEVRARSLAEDLVLANEEIAAQAARIAELEALLAGGGDPPPASTMLVGASVQRRGTESWGQALSRFETQIGKPVQCVRRFISGRPPANPATNTVLADVLDGRYQALAISFVDGTTDEIATFLRGLPATGTRYYVAIRHEPDKGLRMSGPAFQAKCDVLMAAIDEVDRTDVEPMFVLMSWLERDGNAATSSLDYMPRTNLDRWVMALDPYLPDAANTYASQAGPTIALWRQLGGSRIAIAEWGVKSTGQVAADQITAFTTDAEADGCEFVMYFNSNEGDNAGAGWDLDLRGQAAIDAFAATIN